MIRRVFAWQLKNRLLVGGLLVAVSAVMGYLASGLEPDYSTENYFPVWSEPRQVYDRFRDNFPRESAHVLVVVEGDDVLSRESLRWIRQLEAEIEALPMVLEVEGPTSVDQIVGDGIIELQPLFGDPDQLSDDELAESRRLATTDPLFAWSLAKPDGTAVTIRVTLEPDAAGKDEGRQVFYSAVRPLIDRYREAGRTISLSGIPIIRAHNTLMVDEDFKRLVPLALGVIILILFLAFRSVVVTVAGFVTMLVAMTWSLGAQGLLGYSMTEISSIIPILIMVISMSDTVHIANDFVGRRAAGDSRRDAVVEAMCRSAGPCFATEIVIACGFLSLIAVNILAIVEFGVTAAIAMMLTWLANMTVFPLLLSLTGAERAVKRGRPFFVRWYVAFLGWIARQTTERPARVIAAVALVLAAAGATATQAEKLSWAFDELRADSIVYQDLKRTEAAHGGLVPVAIYVEAEGTGENRALEPEVLDFLDRAAEFLRSFPEIQYAHSPSGYIRKAHAAFLGEDLEPGEELPRTRELAAQEVEFIAGDGLLTDVLSFERDAAAAVGAVLDVGSRRVLAMFEDIDAWIEAEQRRFDADAEGPRVQIHATGQLRLFREANEMLVQGLMLSLGGAILLTLLIFAVVLRSPLLAVIGIIPNISPTLITVAFMAISGITLRPTTVILFSIVLVIAADDTMQYLARLRQHYARARAAAGGADVDLHRAAALHTLRDSGLAMFITSTAITSGFLLLLFSEFQALADLGLLIGIALFSAVFVDLFVAPILVMKLRPRLD